MFNPDIKFDLSTIWDILPSVYQFLSSEEKETIESVWKGFFEGLEALNYNIQQSAYTNYLNESRGYIENSYEDLNLYLEGPGKTIYNSDLMLGMNIKSLQTNNNYLYAASDSGIYRCSIDNHFWEEFGTVGLNDSFLEIKFLNGEVYSYSSTNIYKLNATSIFESVYIGTSIKDLIYINGWYFVCTDSDIYRTVDWDETFKITSPLDESYLRLIHTTSDIYLATNVGIHSTDNTNISWTSILTRGGITDILTDNTNLYVGAGDGLLETAVSSVSWSAVTSTNTSIIALFNYNSTIYALSHEDILERDDSSGISWNSIKDVSDKHQCDTFVVDEESYVSSSLGIEQIGTPTDTPLNKSFYYYNLPSGADYLSIKALKGHITEQVLLEDDDYIIDDFSKLKFLKSFSTTEDASSIYVDPITASGAYGETYTTLSGIVLNPTISSIYFPALGSSNPKADLQRDVYVPFVSGYWNIASTHEQMKVWSNHLIKFIHATVGVLRQQPSISNHRQGYSLVRGLPFAYNDCTYDSSWSEGGLNYIKLLTSGSTSVYDTFEVKQPVEWNNYSSGDSINKFDILVSGVDVYDWHIDSGITQSLVEHEPSPEAYYHVMGINETNRLSGLYYSDDIAKFYLKDILPANLYTPVFNRAPEVAWSADDDFYNYTGSNNIATLTALTSDPEDDILYYRWRYKGPFTDYTNTFQYEPVINGNKQSESTVTLPSNLLVDSAITMELEVNDKFNIVLNDAVLYVSGQYQFDSWGDTEFKLGDLNIPYNKITEMNN